MFYSLTCNDMTNANPPMPNIVHKTALKLQPSGKKELSIVHVIIIIIITRLYMV